MKNRFTHEIIIKATMAIQRDKEKIEARIAKGDTYIELGNSYGVTPRAFKTIASGIGIEIKRRTKNSIGTAQSALVTVVCRMAEQLGVDHSELAPFK